MGPGHGRTSLLPATRCSARPRRSLYAGIRACRLERGGRAVGSAMKSIALAAGLFLQAAQPPAPAISQECQIETVTLCDQAGCRGVEPTLKLYVGEFTGEDGKQVGYYYRCRRGDYCDIIDNPWIAESGGYRAFVARER